MFLSDARVREQALDPRESFIVEAPAGSGKTELLVRRFLTLLKKTEHPESILAITFTRKAASEMKERVLKALNVQNQDTGLLEDRLRIMTIDAFCKEIVMTAPLQSHIFAADMLEEEATLAADFLEALLQIIEEREAGAEDLIRLFQYFDNQLPEVASFLLKLLRNREEWLALVLMARQKGALPSLLQSSIQALYERLAEELNLSVAAVQEIKHLIPELFTQKWELRKRLSPHLKALASELTENEKLRDVYLHIAHLPPLDFEPHAILPVLLRILPVAAAHLKVLFEAANKTDFHEIALTALTLLQDADLDILSQLDAEIKHLLIDEFQDTSNLQFQLLKLLTAEWTVQDGRTLFLVGDPKQSIYRFRDADVSLFLEAKHRGIGAVKLTALELTENFRTDASLLKWINGLCANFFPKVEDERLGKVCYKPSIAHRSEDSPESDYGLSLFDSEHEEALAIATKIKALPPAESVAILVRARTHYETLMRVFQDQGLSYSVADDKRWVQSVFLDDVLSLLYVLSNPGDRLSGLALLHSPFCGWSIEDIYAFVKSGQTLWEGIPVLRDLIVGEGAKLSLYERFVQATKILIPSFLKEEEIKILQRVMSVVLHLDILPAPPLFREALARYDFGENNPDVPVMFLTIHQAKGLEFDWVFLPALHKRVAGNDAPLLYTETFYHHKGFYFLLAERKSRGGEASSLYAYIDWLEKQKAGYETMRLFYVALTRAKHGLFLSAVAEKRIESASKPPVGSFLSFL